MQTSYSALAFVQQPTNTLVNAAITPSPTLTVAEDRTNSGDIPVPLTLSSGNANAILAGTTTQTSVLGGAATFSGLSVTAPSTMNTLDALLNITPTGYAGKSYALSATSSNFIVEPLTTQLAYANPSAGALGAGGRVAYVTVDEEDANGNIVTTAGDTITLSVTSTGGYSATYMAQSVNGVATFNLSSAALAPGNYTYTASYSTLTPAIAMEMVTKGTPSITEANSSISYGTASTILTANLAYSGPPPTGAVTFQVDSGAIVAATCTGASSPLSCSATYTTSSLNAGGHTITVTVGADQNYNTASGSGTLTLTPVAPTITFSTAATYSYGQSFQLAATSSSSGAFTYSLASGPAAVTMAGAVAVTGEGTVVLQASQAAAGGYKAGLKQASFNAIKASSTTALAAIIVKSGNGSAASLSVTVPPQYSGTPSGHVTFYDGSNALATVAVSGGKAAYTTAQLAGAEHTFSATYSGDTNFNMSNSPNVPLTIAVTQVSLQVEFANLVYPLAPVFGILVSPTSGKPAPTGTVVVYDGTKAKGTYPLLAFSSGRLAGLLLPSLNVGTHLLTAVYSGDAHYASGGSAVMPVTVTVTPGPVAVALQCSSTKLTLGQTLSCQVNAHEGLLPVTGIVTYTITNSGSGIVTLNQQRQGTITYTAHARGTLTLTANYAAQGDYQAASPVQVAFAVN